MSQALLTALLLLYRCSQLQGETIGGNSDSMDCYFPFKYEGLMHSSCIDINHDKPWCATTQDYDTDKRWGECIDEDLASLPSIDTLTPQNVSVFEGETARLMCTVNNLQGKKVSWQKKGQHYPLTASTFSFLSNGRFRVEHQRESQWNLLIVKANRSNSGIYRCKVSTNTRQLVREIHLTVNDKPPYVSPAVSLGDKSKIYITKGKELRLQCNTSASSTAPLSIGRKVIPPEVEWFKDGNRIDSNNLNRVTISNLVIGRLRISTLTIGRTVMDDSGVYICMNTEETHAEVAVRILNVDRDNKKRGTASEAPPMLGQVGGNGDTGSATTLYISTSLLLLGLLSHNMT